MNLQESLMEKALQGHSRLKDSINSIQEQLCYLQSARSLSKETASQIEESDSRLQIATNNLSQSLGRFQTYPINEAGDAVHSTLLKASDKTTEYDKSPKMQLKDLNGSTSEFDLTAILSHLSTSDLNTSNLSTDSSKDELICLLEKISNAGKDLQVELEGAKEREATLKSELSNLKQKVHSFNIPPDSISSCKNGFNDTHHVAMKCEKLQDAMLSLQDENIRLNRLLRENERVSLNSIATSPISSLSNQQDESWKEELHVTQQKLEQVRGILAETTTQQQRTEEKYKQEREERKHLQALVNQMKAATKSIRDDFNNLDATDGTISLLKLENEQHVKRIENLEWQLNLHQKSTCNEQSYLSRIDDLNKLLIHKENELHALKAQLRKKDEDILIQQASVEQKKGGDITKRKEVLLLCEKYEMLRKNQKRLEDDLRTSQAKLQEEHTRRWSLETSLQQLTTENEELKNCHGDIKKLKTEALENASIIRDYERLTQKYESLLSLRLHEYNRLKKTKSYKKKEKKHGNSEILTQRLADGSNVHPALTQAQNEMRFNRIEKFIMGVKQPAENDLEMNESHTRSKSVDSAVYERQCLRDIPMTRKYLHDTEVPVAKELPIVDDRMFRTEEPRRQIPTPRYKSKYARENLATKVVEQAPSQKVTSFYENECRTYDNVITSTPVKEKPHNKLAAQDVPSLKLYVKKSDPGVNRQCLPDHIMTKERITDYRTPQRFEFSRRGRSNFKNVSNNVRAKSLSPQRQNTEYNDSAVLTSRSNNSALQPKVSFNLPHQHHRSLSAVDGDRSRYKSRFLKNLDKSLSPLEVQQIVRNAYEEEYIKNMKGVNSLSKFTPPEIRKKLFDSNPVRKIKKVENKSPFSEEYLKIMEEINQLKRNHVSVSSSSSDLKTLTPRSIASDRSTPRKGILKQSSSPKVSDSASSNISTNYLENQQNTASQSDTRTDEDNFNNSVDKIDESVSDKSFGDKDFIIDVIPHCHRSSLASSNEEKQNENGRKEICKNISTSARRDDPHRTLRIEDLTIPYQLQSAKDSDTESSVSTTRDHIGRFEFLQDIQSHSKKHVFSHQKSIEDEKIKSLEAKKEVEENVNLIGLSARQQEYADKLVKKYIKINNSQ